MPHSFYGQLYAKRYDRDEGRHNMLAYYLKRWDEAGRPSPVLEPLCGTGFFLIPFLEAGADIDGLDSSPYMLAECQKKAQEKNLSPQLYQQFLRGVNKIMILFTEIFPINNENTPTLTTYRLTLIGSLDANEIGGKLRYRLQNIFGGHWDWDREQKCLLADKFIDNKQLSDTLQTLWAETDKIFQQNIESIDHAPNLSPSTQGIAKFVAQALLQDVEGQIKNTLTKSRQDKGRYYINLICNRYGWEVNGQPAVSLSIRSNIDYKDDLKTFILKNPNQDVQGLYVTDKTKPFNAAMEITAIIGSIGEQNRRKRLLSYDLNDKMRQLIKDAPDDELVVQTNGQYQYVVSALGLRVLNKHYERFEIVVRRIKQ